MRIAHVIEAGRYGGPNRAIIEICKMMKNEHDFIVLCGNDNVSQFRAELKEIDVRAAFLPLTRLRNNKRTVIQYLLFFIYECILLALHLKKENIQVIHNHTYIDFKALLVGRLLRIPVIWHLHSSELPVSIRPMFYLFLRIHRGNIICCSELTRKVFIPINTEKEVNVIQSPVDMDLYQFKNRAKRPILTSNVAICCVANFHPDKGHELLIRSIAILVNDFDLSGLSISLHLKGKVYPNQRSYVQSLIELSAQLGISEIVYFNYDDKLTVNEFLQDKDIFVLASRAEASPLSVWEAASTGLPIICTAVGDVAFYVEKYNCGRIVYERKPEIIAIEMKDLLLNMGSVNYAKNSRTMVTFEFSSELARAKYKAIYKSVLFFK